MTSGAGNWRRRHRRREGDLKQDRAREVRRHLCAPGRARSDSFNVLVIASALVVSAALIQANLGLASARSIEISPINLASDDKLQSNEQQQQQQKLAASSEHLNQTHEAPLGHLKRAEEASSIVQTSKQTATETTSTTTKTTKDEQQREAKSSSGKRNAAADEDDQEEEEDGSTGAGHADHDAPDCEGLSARESATGARLSDNARLVKLQTCLQAKVKRRLAGATRAGLELFERLSLSGACAASLMNLMASLGDIRAFAFKFLDASAKIPSGMMYGLLSDFGDFDQCLSIRSNPLVEPEHEAEENAYSGKYCLLSMRLDYHVQPGPNGSAPDGIYADGVLWDDLVRNYWTSNSNKGFQVGVCVPSRCDHDDLEQIYKLVAETYNFQGQVANCQDGNDLRRQQTPDRLQAWIVGALVGLLALSLVASCVERYAPLLPAAKLEQARTSLLFELIVCFSLSRNWRLFLRHKKHEREASEHEHEHERAARETGKEFERARGGQGACVPPAVRPNSLATGGRAPALRHQIESFTSNLTESTQVAGDLSHQSSFESDHAEGSLGGALDQVEALNAAKIVHCYRPLHVEIAADHRDHRDHHEHHREQGRGECPNERSPAPHAPRSSSRFQPNLLGHLSGLKLLVIVWITVGHSFLYPSANNYQYYRSIINMNITRDSVWFATTNFTLAIDMLLYMAGLVFVYKLAEPRAKTGTRASASGGSICGFLAGRVLHLWPGYLGVIGLAIVMPLASDGPMWPEMVGRRLGAACRENWWANLLMINNFMSEPKVCLPSSWFVSAMMQCFLVGSLVIVVERRGSLKLALAFVGSLIFASALVSFVFAYKLRVRAPAIRMDESFVLEIDDTIYRLYTSTSNNLGPFLVGMLGGFLLVRWRRQHQWLGRPAPAAAPARTQLDRLGSLVCQLNVAIVVGLVAILVLSSVFHLHYTRLWSSIYWSCHRLGWALVTGYLIHQCATGRWRLLADLLSLNSLLPLSRLIFTAYLVYPIFIHVHSGLVRDGLHVSIYNMLNIYTTRLVLTFVTALALHLFVELPLRSVEKILATRWRARLSPRPQKSAGPADKRREVRATRLPLLALAEPLGPLLVSEKAPIISQTMDGSECPRNERAQLGLDGRGADVGGEEANCETGRAATHSRVELN